MLDRYRQPQRPPLARCGSSGITARAGLARRWPARENLAMAVPMSVTSTMWSRRPAITGQSRSRTRICMLAITTPDTVRVAAEMSLAGG